MELAILYLYAYLVGSVPATYLTGRLVKGIDLRKYGSGNLGGSNVFRTVGRWWIVPPGLFEVFVKGASPIWVGLYVLDMEKTSIALVGAAWLSVAGHNWSVFLKFTGGRGIATSSGAIFALAPYPPFLIAIFAAIAVAGSLTFRSSATWVYISLLLLPLWGWVLGEPAAVNWFFAGLIGVVSAKRLVANWEALPSDRPWRRVLLNRLLKDRDVDRREDWVARTATETSQEGPG